MSGLMKCENCGETDGRVETCHGCGNRFCMDNCIAAANDEHGLYWCHDCVTAADEREARGEPR